jgi:hypothetical protein
LVNVLNGHRRLSNIFRRRLHDIDGGTMAGSSLCNDLIVNDEASSVASPSTFLQLSHLTPPLLERGLWPSDLRMALDDKWPRAYREAAL